MASESSILTFTNPLLVVIFATIFMKVRYRFYQWIGVLFGLIGVIITMGAQVELKVGILFGLLSAVLGYCHTISEKMGRVIRYVGFICLSDAIWWLTLITRKRFGRTAIFIVNPQSLLILLWLSIFPPSFNLQGGIIFCKIVIQEKQVPIYF